MKDITNFAEFLSWVGRPLIGACSRCGCTLSEKEVKLIIKSENDNISNCFLPIKCTNCDKEMSVVVLITNI